MATFRWLFTGCMLLASPLKAENPPAARHSLSDVRCDLIGSPVGVAPDTSLGAALRLSDFGGYKAPGLAAVFSLVLPGSGELYAGDFSSGKYFLMSEGLLWLTYAAFEIYGNAVRDDARLYAVSNAGVNSAGKNDQFYVDVGNFLNVADYNDKKLRDRTPSLVYDPSAGYAWQWSSDAQRLTFRDMRVKSENMYNDKKFVGAALLINHVASAINAARAAISHNSALKELMGDLRFSASVIGGAESPRGIMITLSRGF
ncbi:MAG TPA: hypothetical protein VK569_01970 [Bacteroidota bacterium]|nr:hypothetical protein [Bacteroidota bacterium]